MIQPSDLGLPFPAWTPGQWDVIARVVSSDKPYVILEAPTGSGKSAIALAVAKLLDRKTVILTGTKQLQRQYVDSFAPSLVEVKGRSNFPCLIEPSLTAAEAICTVGASCEYTRTPGCPYVDQRIRAERARSVVTNYAFWLRQVNHTNRFVVNGKSPGLLVCDEAHTLEDEVRKFAGVKILRAHCQRVSLTYPAPNVAALHRFANAALTTLAGEHHRLKGERPTDLAPDERKRRRAILDLYAAAEAINKIMDDDAWVIETEPWGMELRPVWASPFVRQAVLRHADKILFMSATVLSKELFAYHLGLPEDQCEFIRADSTFPAASRPLYYGPVGKVKGGAALQEILPALVDRVDGLLEQHPADSGLVHTVSYDLASKLVERSRHRLRLITHRGHDRLEALERFRRTPGAVLVSPSMTTGVDLPYDLCRFQVICKLAFPYLGDPQIKKRMKLGPDGNPSPLADAWYRWVTACALVQTYGRGMRAADDSCTTYLLDGSWGWFKHSVRDMLPQWFWDAVKDCPAVPSRLGTTSAGNTESLDDWLDAVTKKIPAKA